MKTLEESTAKSTRRNFLKMAGSAAVFSALPGCVQPKRSDKKRARPNIVFILADDLGNSDLSCTGSELYQTPNIDNLAMQSMRFSDAHAPFPTCAPSRMSILTGKYPARLGCWNHGRLGGVEEGNCNLPLKEVTYAEVLKKAGYVTGHIGKWHCGQAGYMPADQGYDYVYGANDFCCIGSYYYPFSHTRTNPRAKLDGMDDVERGRHLTKILSEKVVEFIRDNKNRPFILNYWDYAVHTPIEADKDKVEKYKSLVGSNIHQKNYGYAALVEHYDEAVGRILDALEENGIADNTIVIFASDNGGAVYFDNDTEFNQVPVTSNYPLRDGKHSQYYGGTRVPMFIKWPGVTQSGSVCNERVIGHDIYPTILAVAGEKGDPRHNAKIDGFDLTPLLKNPESRLKRDELHWLRYPEITRYLPGTPKEKGPCGSILKGDWKLIEYPETLYGQKQSLELYNVKEDISETNDLSAMMPEKVAELKKAMYKWRKKVNAPVHCLQMYKDAVKKIEDSQKL